MQTPSATQLLLPLAATAAAFLPPIAGALVRRSPRDPAAQVAFAWLVPAIAGALGVVQFMLRPALAGLPLGGITPLFLPSLLLPPTLTWIGPTTKRWQWPAIVVWVLVVVVAAAKLGQGRAFRTAFDPFMGTVMCALSGWAFASCIRRHPDRIWRCDWFWILLGHIVYFLFDTLRFAVIEYLVAQHSGWMLAVDRGVMLIYIGAYLMISRGVLLRSDLPLTPRVAPSY